MNKKICISKYCYGRDKVINNSLSTDEFNLIHGVVMPEFSKWLKPIGHNIPNFVFNFIKKRCLKKISAKNATEKISKKFILSIITKLTDIS